MWRCSEAELGDDTDVVDVLSQGLQHRKRLLERDVEDILEQFAKDSE
jgi:hypothetical protein